MDQINPLRIYRTRFKGMGFSRVGNNWRFFDISAGMPAAVGPQYASKAELLADLTRYATEYGCEQNAA